MSQKKSHRQPMKWKSEPTAMGDNYQRPEGDGPIAWGYTRNSHQDSVDSGLGYNAAKQTIQRHFRMVKHRLAKRGIVIRPGKVFYDKAISAYRVRFCDRPAGTRLMEVLRPGDHIIFPRLDRAFRWGKDAYAMIELFMEQGVIIHFCDMQVDMSTAVGKMMVGQMIVMAQWYSDFISERTKDALYQKKKKGLPIQPRRRFHRKTRYQGMSLGIPTSVMLVVQRWVVPSRESGLSKTEMARKLEKYAAKKERRATKLMDADYMASLGHFCYWEYKTACAALGRATIRQEDWEAARAKRGLYLPRPNAAKTFKNRPRPKVLPKAAPIKKNLLLQQHYTFMQIHAMTLDEREREYQRLLEIRNSTNGKPCPGNPEQGRASQQETPQ